MMGDVDEFELVVDGWEDSKRFTALVFTRGHRAGIEDGGGIKVDVIGDGVRRNDRAGF